MYAFYNNINIINTHLYNMKHYVNNVINTMDMYTNTNAESSRHYSFMSFAATVDSHSYVLKELQRKLQCISPFSPSVFKLAEVGYLLKMFYILHNDKHIEKVYSIQLALWVIYTI